MLFKKCFLTITLCLLCTAFSPVKSAKILAIYSFPGTSHYSMHRAVIRELVERGHEVTMVTALSLKNLNLGSNYTEILIEPVYDFWDDIKADFGASNLFELTSMTLMGFIRMLDIIGYTTTEHALKQPKVQEIINAKETDGVYDLLLCEQFYQESFLALSRKYNIPVVTTTTLGYENYMSQMMGIISPWSYVPHGFLPFTDRMNIWERAQNVFYSLLEDLHREFIYFPKMDAITQKYFGHLEFDVPKVSAMEKNISAILLNSHVPLTTARPYAVGMIPVGGMHIYPPKPLPADIQKFLDEADHGAIYLSFGSNVQSKDMPEEMLKVFFDVFSKLKQRVLWKFENESIKNLPANIMIKKWLPQSDILAHRNIKVFITHGGLFGTQEGVHYGVPMLGFPFYCDQHLNMNKAVQGGYAISLHFQSITAEILRHSLTELMENPKYKQNVQQVSRIFRDRPLNARDTAMYWIEYVIRHKGAPHLRNAGLDLAWYEFYLLDIAAILICGIILVVVLMRLCLKKIFSKQKNTTIRKQKQT